MENHTRERLTGAVILVALVVLLVPELLSGPHRTGRHGAADSRPPSGAGGQGTRPARDVLSAVSSAAGSAGAAAVKPGRVPEARGSDGERPATAADEPPMQSYTLPLTDEPRSAALGEPGVALDVPPRSEHAGEDATSSPTADAPRADASKAGASRANASPPSSGASGASRSAGASEGETGSAAVAHAPAVAHVPAGAHVPVEAHAPAAGHGTQASHPARPAHAGGRGWTVQLGSFASRENADRLVHQMKLKGYGAFVSETSSHGRKWYRVRVGPEQDRAAAAALEGRLRATGHAGALVPP